MTPNGMGHLVVELGVQGGYVVERWAYLSPETDNEVGMHLHFGPDNRQNIILHCEVVASKATNSSLFTY